MVESICNFILKYESAVYQNKYDILVDFVQLQCWKKDYQCGLQKKKKNAFLYKLKGFILSIWQIIPKQSP